MIAAGCAVEPATHNVVNGSDQRVVISYIATTGTESKVAELDPGQMTYLNSFFGTRDCSPGVLVARALDGRELERREHLCPGDTWRITDAGDGARRPKVGRVSLGMTFSDAG
jgi:hypothetical protein